MSTAISAPSVDLEDEADIDHGFESVPRMRRRHRGGVRALNAARAATDQRPRDGRPGGVVAPYGRGPVRTRALGRAQGPHPMARVEQAQVGYAVLAMAALLSALVVTALIGLAHWRAGTFGGEAPATAPAVVERQSVPDGVGGGVPQ
ncbi:hypothetical protein ACW2Q0_19745 [Nocardia sp. R16R-3T]